MKEYSKIVHKSDKTRKKNVRIETIGFEKLYKSDTRKNLSADARNEEFESCV